MTRGDVFVVGAVIILACASLPVAMAGAFMPTDMAIVTGPGGTSTLDLNTPGTFAVEGRVGTVFVAVGEGTAWVHAAECPDRMCMGLGQARPGRPVVCAPNGVSVQLVTGGGEGLDAISR